LVRSLLFWDKEEWRRWLREGKMISLFKGASSLKKALRERSYDLAIDCQGLLRSRLLAWLSGAEIKVGFQSKEPGGLLMDKMISKGPDSHQFCSEYLFLLKTLGLESPEPLAYIVLDEQLSAQTSQRLKRLGIKGDYVVLAPFTTRPQKHWMPERWIEIVGLIRKRWHLPVLILGGPGDAAAAAKMAAATQWAVSLAGVCSLAESAALIQGATLLVGVDTGLTHLGTAFVRPTVALFGATRPYLHTPSPKTAVIYHEMECSPCRRRPVCGKAYTCMKAIVPEEVIESCDPLLRC